MTIAYGWTEADQAEFDVVVFVLVRDVRDHRARCAACAASGSAVYCKRVDQAIREVLGWQQLRGLLSKAEALRAQTPGMTKLVEEWAA